MFWSAANKGSIEMAAGLLRRLKPSKGTDCVSTTWLRRSVFSHYSDYGTNGNFRGEG